MSKNNETDLTHLTDRKERSCVTPTGVCARCAGFERITIGNHTLIKPGPSGNTVWIESETGEGMETPEAHLEQAIKEYFRTNF